MENLVLTIIFFISGTIIILLMVYYQQKRKGEFIKLFEKRTGIRLSPSFSNYKGKYGRYELEFMFLGGVDKKVIVKLKHDKKFPVIFTNYSEGDIVIGFFSQGKLFYKKLKLPLSDGKNFNVFVQNEIEGKRFIYSNQNIIEDINYLAMISKPSGCLFVLKPGEFELKFPDVRLITKEIIDAAVRIIDKL